MESSSCSSSHEVGEGPQLHMQGHEDLDQLKLEIAEASTEEKKLSTNSPTLQSSMTSLPDDEHPSELGESMHEDIVLEDSDSSVEDFAVDKVEQETTSQECQEDKEEQDSPTEVLGVLRPPSPIDESSWVLVDRDERHDESERTEGGVDTEQLNTLVFRKFIASRDLTQKLMEIGLSATLSDKDSMNSSDMYKSIVFIHAHSVTDGNDEEGQESELAPFPLRPTASTWAGVYSGAKVNVGVEEKAGLFVASVRVWHRDLLSALAALQSLVQSTGMISYADVDVPSLLARAA